MLPLSILSFSSCSFLQKAVSSAIVFPPALCATFVCCAERSLATGLSIKVDILSVTGTLGTDEGFLGCVFSFDFDRDLLLLLLLLSLDADL